MDLEKDLSLPVTPVTGRHPLPSTAEFAATLSRLGIGNHTNVACYDSGQGTYAARLWWMLRWVGHDAVSVLDGGFAAWTAEGRPVSTERAARPPARFVPHPRPGLVLDASGVATALARGETLVDVRGAERFAGTVEPIDAVAGHVPGAKNLPFVNNLGPMAVSGNQPSSRHSGAGPDSPALPVGARVRLVVQTRDVLIGW